MQDTNSQNIPTFKELRAKVERICSTNMKVHSKSKTIKLYARSTAREGWIEVWSSVYELKTKNFHQNQNNLSTKKSWREKSLYLYHSRD